MYLAQEIKYNAQICSLKIVHLFGKTRFIYAYNLMIFNGFYRGHKQSHRNSLVTTRVYALLSTDLKLQVQV